MAVIFLELVRGEEMMRRENKENSGCDGPVEHVVG